jgi:hypothetical protein
LLQASYHEDGAEFLFSEVAAARTIVRLSLGSASHEVFGRIESLALVKLPWRFEHQQME